jgi:hypothetical protein
MEISMRLELLQQQLHLCQWGDRDYLPKMQGTLREIAGWWNLAKC